jgi:hypothetical protein
MRWLAAGLGTRARALVTSRFPLGDLSDWSGAGHREERLDDLEPAAAVAVLRGWGVKGDDTTLDGLAAPLHYHALSVAVLGSYLGKLWGGDPTKAPTFDRGEESGADPKASKLTRILTHYAQRLPNAERDLLARLSTFPRGVTVEFLGFLIDAGEKIAGALVGCNQVRLLRLLEQLRDLGLVFRYDTPQGATFSAHPFLRDYFRELLGVTRPQEIHEAVRARLSPSLEARPENNPTDPAMLDRYEALIEHTQLAGRSREASNLYRFGLGGFRHLGGMLGDYARGLRILSAFSPDGTPEAAAIDLPAQSRERLVFDWGLFAEKLGDLATARRALAIQSELGRSRDDATILSGVLQNQADIELLAGNIPVALRAAVDAVTQAEKAGDRFRCGRSQAYVATACARLGHLDGARRHFAGATHLEGKSELYFLRGLQEAEFRTAIGDRVGAVAQTRGNRDFCKRHHWVGVRARCETLLGLLALPDDLAAARRHLGSAREFGSRSGHVEVQLRCYHLAAEIARTEQAFALARSEAEAGIHLADTCGFGHYAIELRLALARVRLDANDAMAALQRAREALDRSVHPECQYAWGEADALDLCGRAHARLGEAELARQRLTAAVAARERLGHPGLADTRAALAALLTA